MINHIPLRLLFWLAVFAWALILLLNGESLTASLFKPSSYVLSGLIILITIFEKWLWRWEKIHPWLVRPPFIQGSWEVKLHSMWIDPETDKRIGPITGYISIEQTLTTMKLRLMTEKSTSQLITHSFLREDIKVCELAALYLNRPKFELRGKQSEIHYGSVLIKISGDDPKKMEGHYWTDRNTSGGIELSNRKKTIFGTYEEANEAFSTN